jgi:radical SAM-linked protein
MPVYRIMYRKEGPARYISHLDLLRTVERSARRASLPIAFTSGFNPRPKMTFAAPLSVGTAGEAEFADLELTEDLTAVAVFNSLAGTLPEGLSLTEVREINEQSPSLMSLVERATYRATGRLAAPVSPEALQLAIDAFLALPEIPVQRKNKAGEIKIYDIRPGIFDISGKLVDDIIIIETELKTGSRNNIRLDEVMDAFAAHSKLPLQGKFSLFRTGLYRGEKSPQMLW